MTDVLRPARPVPPGRILKQELDPRDWGQKDLAAILGRPEQMVSEIVNGTKQITPETSLELAQAFGNSPEFWHNLEANYRLELARRLGNDDTVARRSHLYSALPLREMAGVVGSASLKSAEDLEREVAGLLGRAVGSSSVLLARLRASTTREPLTYAQLAWLRPPGAGARTNDGSLGPEHLEPLVAGVVDADTSCRGCSACSGDTGAVGCALRAVAPLEKTYLDGAAFWLDERPAVGLTLRYDRIDSFWFTLMHELAHLAEGEHVNHLDQLEGGEENPTAAQISQIITRKLQINWPPVGL